MLNFKVVTPEGVRYESKTVVSITLPTQSGVITVMDNHEPIITLLKAGAIIINLEDGTSNELAVSTGMVEIRKSSVVNVLADTAERAEAIDVERALEARRKAQEYLSQHEDQIADIDYARLQAVIERETARISLGNKYRKINVHP